MPYRFIFHIRNTFTLNGISYYAENQWQCAALQPKHLTAICPWEGAADYYRDMAHHGGIFCNGFTKVWSEAQVYTIQHGRGTNGYRSTMNGDWVSGPITLTEEELGANRNNFYEDCLTNKLDTDEFWTSRMPDWSKVNGLNAIGGRDVRFTVAWWDGDYTTWCVC